MTETPIFDALHEEFRVDHDFNYERCVSRPRWNLEDANKRIDRARNAGVRAQSTRPAKASKTAKKVAPRKNGNNK